MNWAAFLWLAALVLFFLIEAGTVAVVSLWFATGSLVALIASLLGAPVWLQAVLFLVVSVGLLLALRPITKKYLKPKLVKTNVDNVIGAEGIVTTAIDNLTAVGQVKLGAMEWSARSTTQEAIPEGTRVIVDRVEGVKVYVSLVKEKVTTK